MILKARIFNNFIFDFQISIFFKNLQSAIAKWKNFMKQIKSFFYFPFGSFWTKIFSFVSFNFSNNRNSRKIIVLMNFYIYKILVISHQNIIFGFEFFDQICLQ